MDKKEKKTEKRNNWPLYFLLGGFVVKFFAWLFFSKKKSKVGQIEKNFIEYLKDEEEEIDEYAEHKISFSRFSSDSLDLFKTFFVPCEKNSHHPRILRSKSLALIVALLAILKITLLVYVFFIQPYTAEMSENISTEIFDMINRDRAAAGLVALRVDKTLSASAMAKADDLVSKNYFAHYSPDGRKPWDFIDRNAYEYLFVGENLAMNFTSAESAHQALMLSPTHKENIMNEKYQDIGIAVVNGELNGKNTNVLVELFGLKKAPVPKIAAADEKTAGVTDEKIIEKTAKAQVQETAKNKAGIKIAGIESTKDDVAPKNKIAPPAAIISQGAAAETVPLPLPTPPSPPENIPVNADKTEKQSVASFPVAAPMAMDEIASAGWENAPAAAGAEKSSPNILIEKNALTDVKSFDNIPDKDIIAESSKIKIINSIIITVLGLLFALLVINIIIKFEIQHRRIFVDTIFAIICLTGIVYLNLNFLESVLPKLYVL